jgi:drug/metabolite transporter (DMT)-like permease
VSAAGPSPVRLYSLLCLMLFFWSLNYAVSKVALREFPPLLLIGLRTSFAAVFILPVYFCKRGDDREVWKWPEFGRVLALGILGIVGNQCLWVIGLAHTSVAHAGIVIALSPILVLLFAAMIGQERLTAAKAAGMLLALAGVATLEFEKNKASGATLLGDLLVFGSAVTFAVFAVTGKPATKRHGGVTVNSFAYVGGSIALFPLTVWQGARYQFSSASLQAWLGVVYMALFSAMIGYLIYYYALTYMAASRVSAFSYLQPLVATLLAIPLLHEGVTIWLMIGGALVLAGVYMTERA